MSIQKLTYLVTIKPSKQGLIATCPDLDISLTSPGYSIKEVTDRIKNSINTIINAQNLLSLPHTTLSDIKSGTIITFVSISYCPNPNIEQIKQQLYQFRLKAQVQPRCGVFCKK